MWPRLSIVVGLVTGVAVAALVLGGLLFLGPAPSPVFSAPPSDDVSAASPSAVASPSSSSSSSPAASSSPSSSGGALFHIGEPAPALVLPQVGGGTIDLANLKGQPVWVNFMGTYCPPCHDEFPLMNGFASRYGEDGLVILAIDVKEEEGTVAAFANELDATFPIGLDTDGAAQAAWDATALPVHFWVDTDGIVRDGAQGGIGSDIMARGVGTILPDVEVTPPDSEVMP
jgi:cytochrome c biogenesis protein CcmG/thiol:disulfide interchange protein DsbE